jgi:hypothetical protein
MHNISYLATGFYCLDLRSKNVLCAAAGRLAAERSEADKPAKAHKTIYLLFFLQTFITKYLRHVKKPGRNFK